MSRQPLPIRLTIPAEPQLLRLARMTAATVCADLDFSIQDIEDVRVAVDELAALLIQDADGDAVLDLCFGSDHDSMIVIGEIHGSSGEVPTIHPVAAELLGLVADSYELRLGDGGEPGFRLVKRRRSLDS